MNETADPSSANHADPICQCGYRKSLHPDRLPPGGWCENQLGGYRYSAGFSELPPLAGAK